MNFKKTITKLLTVSLALGIITATLASCSSEKKTRTGRFDYFNTDLSNFLTLSPEDYTSMVATLSESMLVTDETVEEYIKTALFNAKEKQNDGAKVDDVAIKYGDTAYIFYEGSVDGVAFDGGSNMSNAPTSPYALSIGSGDFIDDFEDQLIGIVPNQTSDNNKITVTVTFPEDMTFLPDGTPLDPSLAGKEATFKVYVSYIVQYEVPTLNYDTIKNKLEYTPSSEDNDVAVAEYKMYVKKSLEATNEQVLYTAAVNNLLEQLINKATFKKIPKSELEYYKDLYIAQYENAMDYYESLGLTFDDFDDFMCQSLGLESGADWESNLALAYTKIIKQHMICHYIAQIEGITLTDEDYEEEINYYIESNQLEDSTSTLTRTDVVELVGEYVIKENAMYSKVCSILYDNAKVIYK